MEDRNDRKDGTGASRSFVFCDSARVNAYGFRTDVAGIDTSDFERNPVMLYQHDTYSVIGRWENIRKEGGRLIGDAVFDEGDELALKIKGKVERGFIKGCSMAIQIKELKVEGGVETATRCVLREVTICAVPADPGALRLRDELNNDITYGQARLALDNIQQQHTTTNRANNMEKKEKTEEKEEQTLVARLEAELADSRRQIEELQNEAKAREEAAVAAYLDAAVETHRITEGERGAFATLAALDFDTVKRIIDGKPASQSARLADMVPGGAPAAGDAAREGWDYLEWMRRDPSGLRRMKSEDPERFAVLQDTLRAQ